MVQRSLSKICLLGASYTTNNMGVSALTDGAIKSILSQFPSAEICLLDFNRNPVQYSYVFKGKKVIVPLVNMRISKNPFCANHIVRLMCTAFVVRLMRKGRFGRRISVRNAVLNLLREADMVGAISGGDSFSDIYGMGQFLYMVLPVLLALILRKKIIFLPQTIGPFRTVIARKLAGFLLSRATLVYSRDYAGLDVAKSFVKEKTHADKFRFCYDVGFLVDPARPENFPSELERFEKIPSTDVVGFNISGLLYMGGYTQKNMFGLIADYPLLVAEIIETFIHTYGCTVMLVPHVFGTASHRESDATICRKIYTDLKKKHGGKIVFPEGTYNQNEIKYIIGLCGFFIGSRMHACIAALSQGIPAIGIAYSRKFQGVMETIGIEGFVADPRNKTGTEIMQIIRHCYEDRMKIKTDLAKKIIEVKGTISNLFKEIADAIGRDA